MATQAFFKIPTQSSPSPPTLIQHTTSESNQAPGAGLTGDNFLFWMPNAVGAGNCLVLAISYFGGVTPSITDTNGNTWPGSPAVSRTSGEYSAAIFVLPNANAGVTKITVSFGSQIAPFQYTCSEFNNIATSSPVNGTSNSIGSGPSLAAGSFTPTSNNDVNGGNLIWSYHAPSAPCTSNPTSWVSGGSFTLLDADIAGQTPNDSFPHSSQWWVQTSRAAVNPSVTATGDAADSFNSCAVALKVAAAGTAKPAGIHVDKVLHVTSTSNGATWNIQLPTVGNLRVLMLAPNIGIANVTSITDNDGGTWVRRTGTSGTGTQSWESANRPANPNLIITVHISTTTVPYSSRFFDISGAAASPFDVAAEIAQDVSGITSVNNFPSITPTTSNGLVLAALGLGNGPAFTISSPSGAYWDIVLYTGEADTDIMDNADGCGHYYNPSTATINWGWTFVNAVSSGGWAGVVAYKKA